MEDFGLEMYGQWVIVARMGYPFCFCPIRGDVHGDCTIISTLNLLTERPPGKLIAIIHKDGREAVDRFCEQYKEELEQLKKALRSTGDLVEPLAALRRCDRDAVI
jgi:hypothetical protein